MGEAPSVEEAIKFFEPQWQPIETAPKSGEWVLLTTPLGLMKVCFWDDRHTVWDRERYDAPWSHWMPLPAAPMGGK